MILTYFDNKKSGPVVLFIHGTASSNEVWQKQYSILKDSSYRLVGVDLRGHGNSVLMNNAGELSDHLNDLNETITYLKISEPITIVGHSFGAVLAFKFAEEYPHKVKKLLLVSLPPKVPQLLHRYYQWLLGKPIEIIKEKSNIIEKLPINKTIKLAIKTDINAIRKIWYESKAWDFINDTPNIKCPIHLSVGRFDYIALKSSIERLHKKFPDSTYKVFNWAGHNCIEQARSEFNEWLCLNL